jgi:hypothetical protein
MLHLLQHAISPVIHLEQTLKDWFQISCSLRESPRSRVMQTEKSTHEGALLS